MRNLYYGDNLEVMRRYIRDETVDLCYIDPPFNSKKNYNQIYDIAKTGSKDKAQAQAFVDTWIWDTRAEEGFHEIINHKDGRFTKQVIALIRGLEQVLGRGSSLAYLISMTLRITEIHRVLKPTGSFYLHCDPTASHYLKLVLDAIFLPQGGEFQNELIWSYKSGGASPKRFARKHDVIFFYTKSKRWIFNPQKEKSYMMYKYGFKKSNFQIDADNGLQYSMVYARDVLEIPSVGSDTAERLGYPTQKPEALLEKIIASSSNEGDVILDAYCGCGTTVAVAEKLKRKWIGIDITYQSISLILRRLENELGQEMLANVSLHGIPKDMDSVDALVHKKDDRLRKEFEKWAVLTYTNNRAIINDTKGADKGIDGIAYFTTGDDESAKVVFQVKSGKVTRGDISKLRGDMNREGAELAVFITLQQPTTPMRQEAVSAGIYEYKIKGVNATRNYPRIQIVTINEIVEENRRMELLLFEVTKKASHTAPKTQDQSELGLVMDEDEE
jgi:site-specific DNA-methyltransferase (adenine-specific)